jgi:hypothetical protein
MKKTVNDHDLINFPAGFKKLSFSRHGNFRTLFFKKLFQTIFLKKPPTSSADRVNGKKNYLQEIIHP